MASVRMSSSSACAGLSTRPFRFKRASRAWRSMTAPLTVATTLESGPESADDADGVVVTDGVRLQPASKRTKRNFRLDLITGNAVLAYMRIRKKKRARDFKNFEKAGLARGAG